ncbi:sulfite exporter TauE/SafE family protein [Acidovorax sp. JHL-9]|uniref:sulfite exporter TauE/SafE family protein n=1 Tax=Acidovorax sp. JHL-9 TaxID=1276756 RepID=UPI00047E0418|nr:sulfite exporter TauE/SafE family protein [Acidovorax sp. JHL-9]
MLAPLAVTALLMGLAGGPHCLAMCSAPCGAIIGQGVARSQAGSPVSQPVQWFPKDGTARRLFAFHFGRLAGYAGGGALAALAMDSLAWVTRQTMALSPVWTLMHVAVMAWGLMMMVQARQPAWVEQAGRAAWRRVQPLVRAPGGLLVAGGLWALMPCGLLYSALLVAALSGSVLQGAVTMVFFGVGSGLWLVGAPWLWGRLRSRINAVRASWGTRLAGALLVGVAGWALWMDLVYKPSLWCR